MKKVLTVAPLVMSVLSVSCSPVVGQALISEYSTSGHTSVSATSECQVPSEPISLSESSASYEEMRNYLISDRLPPSEEVRVEDFVDFFPTGYEVNGEDFLVSLDVAPSPFASEGKVLMRLVVQAPSFLTGASMPERLVIMTDISDSMGDLASDEFSSYGLESLKKYELVNLAVEHFISSLPDGIVVSYEFGKPRGYLLDPALLGVANSNGISREGFLESFQRANQPLGDHIRIGLSDGIEAAWNSRSFERSTLFLVFSGDVRHLGDLDPPLEEDDWFTALQDDWFTALYADDWLTALNDLYTALVEDDWFTALEDDLTASTLLHMIRHSRRWGSLAIIGVSVSPSSADVLKTAAAIAGGTYHHIHLSEQVKHLFADNPQRLLSVASPYVSMEVDFDPAAVASYRLLGFDGSTGEVCEKMAESSFLLEGTNLGGEYTILYELDLVDRSGSGSVLESLAVPESLADVNLIYRRLSRPRGRVNESFSKAQVYERFEEASPHFRLAAVAAEFAEVLRTSPYPRFEDLARLMAEADTLAEEFPINWDGELNPSDFAIPELPALLKVAAFLMQTKPSYPTG